MASPSGSRRPPLAAPKHLPHTIMVPPKCKNHTQQAARCMPIFTWLEEYTADGYPINKAQTEALDRAWASWLKLSSSGEMTVSDKVLEIFNRKVKRAYDALFRNLVHLHMALWAASTKATKVYGEAVRDVIISTAVDLADPGSIGDEQDVLVPGSDDEYNEATTPLATQDYPVMNPPHAGLK
ncbi:hypothetical protein FRB94_010035 [Tulasnella sp. JGI-2019a]|nr:hypothetical protein FRB94_010035 [Tulasnella sp. JGI-2019a]